MELMGARVLVTGATGFLGKYVVPTLTAAGAQVFGVGKALYDLRNEAEAALAVLAARPDVVVHLAAATGGVANTSRAPAAAFRDNMTMALSVIHASAVQGAKVIFMSSAHVYAPSAPAPFREEDIWRGAPHADVAPYAGAKRAALVMLEAYRKQHGLRYLYLVPTAMYGPGDNVGDGAHVVPAMIRRFADAKEAGAKKVVCWGSGKPLRTFLHAADAARAVLSACGAWDVDGVFNLCGTEEISVRDLAERIAGEIGWKGDIAWDDSKPDGMPRIALDGTEAKEHLHWTPETPLADGLARTIRWYEEARGTVAEPA